MRLVTLTGPGGTGKTRLALAVAAEVVDEFADGAWFVDLSSLSDPGLVASAIARVFDIKEQAGRPIGDSLVDALACRDLLLVLDNFEHVIDAALVVSRLVESCPRIKVLVTSRAILHLSCEYEVVVPPLAVPDPRHLPELGQLATCPSVALFAQRAQLVRPDLQINSSNAQAIAEICVRLDGLPLAIELAAPRVKLLLPRALLGRLNRRLALLTGGPRDLPARQRTLRATLDWSYSLLERTEQAVFARLGVMVGGAGLDAIEQVCQLTSIDCGDVLDVITSLVDKSLLRQWEGPDGEPRVGMLETVREYALERLEANPQEAAAARLQHARYFASLAELAAPHLSGRNQVDWLRRLDADHDNLRAALEWSLTMARAELAVQLAGAVYWFWLVRGYFSEGRDWLAAALACPGPVDPLLRARALHAAGVLAWNQGDLAGARSLLERALTIRQEQGDRRGTARTIANLAVVSTLARQIDEALQLHETSLALYREIEDREGIANTLNNLGILTRDAGQLARARGYLEECLAMRQDLGDRQGAARALVNLGLIERKQGQLEAAREHFRAGVELAREVGVRDVVAFALEGLAYVARARGDPTRAARLLGAADALRDAIGAPLQTEGDRADRESCVTALRAALGESSFSAAWAAGRALTGEAALCEGLARPTLEHRSPGTTPQDHGHPLSRREREVAVLIARGATNRQIADELVITEGTAGLHVVHILSKLGLANRAQVAAWAVERGLANP